MTNRDYLNTLSDEEFASVVLAKVAELHEKNFDDELDIFDIAIDEQLDFEQWLKQEHISIGADDELVLKDFMKKTEKKQ